MLSIALSQLPFEYRPSRRRRTLSIQVRPGSVKVLYPSNTCERELQRFILSKEHWILKHYVEPPVRSEAPLKSGDRWLWLGQEMVLAPDVIIHSQALGEAFFNLTLCQQKAWLLDQCTEFCQQNLVAVVAELYSAHNRQFQWPAIQHIKVRPYKSRWGSCSTRGVLTFNSLLAMAPDWVRRYVVAHELAHLSFMNHSRDFWRVVGLIVPAKEVRLSRQWLNDHSEKIFDIYR